MKTGTIIIANEFDPLIADDDWPFTAETIEKWPVDNPRRHPSIDQHPFRPRLGWGWSFLDGGRWNWARHGVIGPARAWI
jgi:hypothetical protein